MVTSVRTTPRKKKKKKDPYEHGFQEGYEQGKITGEHLFHTPFEGTSIIIPTYNQVSYLRQCIESVFAHTTVPFEIIVVDNASTDETAHFLHERQKDIRYCIHDRNRGFSGGMNTGLMMAKGKTIVLLNNDIVVTQNWLENMLTCLNSDERIGIVGPLTNYIGGEQQIATTYQTLEEMHAFANEFNVSNAKKWMRIDRLVGFCCLFRKQLFRDVGYFDEGFEFGNYEDEDYMFRVRLLNYSLVISGDTFVHHYGSVSMKALGDAYESIQQRNSQFFYEKWQNANGLLYSVKLIQDTEKKLSMGHFYPMHVCVKGVNDTLYWLADGKKHPIKNNDKVLPVTRVSQIDLTHYPIGESIESERVLSFWFGRETTAIGNDEPIPNGQMLRCEKGTLYQMEHHKLRKVIGEHAEKIWHLHEKRQLHLTSSQRDQFEEGLPIIATTVVNLHSI